MQEIWHSIAGFPDYEVSDLGRVRSVKKNRNALVLKPQKHTGGYRIVTFWSNGTPTIHFVHKLVLAAFIGPRPEGMQACHGNGVEADNRLVNLRWDTPKANQADRAAHGTRYGRPGSSFRATPAIVARVRRGLSPNITALARELKLPRTTVADIVNRRTHGGL
jgi:hypothetical protein